VAGGLQAVEEVVQPDYQFLGIRQRQGDAIAFLLDRDGGNAEADDRRELESLRVDSRLLLGTDLG